MGECGAGVGRPPGRPREERFRVPGTRRGSRCARPFPGATVRAEFVEVTRHSAGSARSARRGPVGRRGLEPRGRCAPRHVHGGAGLRQLGARAGHPTGAGPAGWERRTGRRPSRSGGCKAPCRSSSASKRAAPTAPPSASRSRAPVTTRARFTVAVEGGRARRGSATRWSRRCTLRLSSVDFVRLGCGRARRQQVEAAGGVASTGRRGGRPQGPRRHELHDLITSLGTMRPRLGGGR